MEASTDRRLVAGRDVLGGPLGRGGMGTVWRAEDTLLGRPVAVKEVELPAGAGAAPGALRERALREARAAARLNHPGVVTLHDVVEADGRLFLVMELVRAPTLRELVDRSGPLTPVLLALLDKDPSRRPPAPAVRRMLDPVAADRPPPTPAGAGAPTSAGAGAPAPTLPLGATQPQPQPRFPGSPPPAMPQPQHRFPGPPIREGSPAEREGRGTVHSPSTWGMSVPPAPGRARGRVQLPGWSAPPRRRRRGRWLLAVAVVLLLLAVASNLDDRSGGDPGPAGLGDPVRDGQFEFVVRAVDCGSRSVGEGFGEQTALGQFCLVSFRVENTGTEGRTFGGGQQYLFDRDGNRHDPDLAATLGNGGGRPWSTYLNPGQRLAGTLVYDVPQGAVPARVELHDAPFSGGATVALD
jgi:hypothetical protein